MIKESENRLKLFQAGDQRIFRVYYERYYHALCMLTEHILKENSAMHDIVQDVFVILWKRRAFIESELHLEMFLYQAVRNRCLNYLKNRKVKLAYAVEYAMLAQEEEFNNKVIEEEVYRLITEEIEHLPPEQKRTVLLHLKGKSNAEIAEIMKVSVNTVKTHKARARKTLKYHLDNLLVMIILLKL